MLGFGCGVETVGGAIRYPDALVAEINGDASGHLVSGVVTMLEVLNPGFDFVDRINKVREYVAVPSIVRYVMVEVSGIGLVVLERSKPEEVLASKRPG